MPRQPRLVVPGQAHHVIQRGSRRMEVFFHKGDYRAYLGLLSESCRKSGTEVWAYCLMPNHVHLILVPSHADGLRAALGETHRQYTRRINLREGWQGHLWQERFHSFVMDESYLLACARYVELNPVRASLVKRPERWAWSSARAHLAGQDDALVLSKPLLKRMPDWAGYLAAGISDTETERLEAQMASRRALGSETWLAALEAKTGQHLRPGKRGRPKKRK